MSCHIPGTATSHWSMIPSLIEARHRWFLQRRRPAKYRVSASNHCSAEFERSAYISHSMEMFRELFHDQAVGQVLGKFSGMRISTLSHDESKVRVPFWLYIE